MKTAISLPDPLFAAATELAERLGVSRSALFQRAMERYLLLYDEAAITAALDDVYADGDGGLDPELGELETEALPSEDW